MSEEFNTSFVPPEAMIDMQRYLNNLIQQLPSDIPSTLVSKFAQDKRVLPLDTPFPGPWDNERTPYLVEIMDNMSVTSPIQHQIVLKAAQIGMTAAAENVVVYWIGEVPASILFISATDALLEKWASKRLEPAIDSCGCRDKIFAQTSTKGSKRTGDKIKSKEFVGGHLDMSSAQSAPGLRADSKRIVVRDEIDGAPIQLKTGEGNWLEVSEARAMAFGDRGKIFDFSTPTTIEDSAIFPEYELGDQRKYLVPCPRCGAFQELRWAASAQAGYGLKPIRGDGGRVSDVYYECEHCHGEIANHEKGFLLKNGYWKPTAIPSTPYRRSYHISSLYSPVGMLSWLAIWEKYEKAKDNPDGMRSFTNLYLGEPYREAGSRPAIENVVELRSAYRSGVVPDGVLYLTAGIDVQRGSERDKKNPPRLEFEICGHGAGFKTFSILYDRIEGAVDDYAAGAWADIDKFILGGGFAFRRADGRIFHCLRIFTDSGDGATMDQVYSWCGARRNTFPTKGTRQLKSAKGGDAMEAFNVRRYKHTKVNEDLTMYTISTNYYKHHTYNNLNNTYRNLDDPDRPGFCQFPYDREDSYFDMLTAEEKRADGSFHCPSGRRNEALDCRVLNLCAGDIYLDSKVFELKVEAKAAGATPKDLELINHKLVLKRLAKAVEGPPPKIL